MSDRLQGPHSECYFVLRHRNNTEYKSAHSLIGAPYLAIIASNGLTSCYYLGSHQTGHEEKNKLFQKHLLLESFLLTIELIRILNN